MILGSKNAHTLHHEMYTSIKWKQHHLGPIYHHGVARWCASIVEGDKGEGWEVGCVELICLVEKVGLE